MEYRLQVADDRVQMAALMGGRVSGGAD